MFEKLALVPGQLAIAATAATPRATKQTESVTQQISGAMSSRLSQRSQTGAAEACSHCEPQRFGTLLEGVPGAVDNTVRKTAMTADYWSVQRS